MPITLVRRRTNPIVCAATAERTLCNTSTTTVANPTTGAAQPAPRGYWHRALGPVTCLECESVLKAAEREAETRRRARRR